MIEDYKAGGRLYANYSLRVFFFSFKKNKVCLPQVKVRHGVYIRCNSGPNEESRVKEVLIYYNSHSKDGRVD